MKNFRYVCVFALSLYCMVGVQQAYATKRISSPQDEERPSKISKNSLQNWLEESKKNRYISPLLIKRVQDMPMTELASYEANITVEHELFDRWITLLLTAFPNTAHFSLSLDKAKVKGKSDRAAAEAQHNLGIMYQRGQGVAQDQNKAVELYTKAADQGYARAQTNLGKIYYHGWGVLQDWQKALDCFTKAADQGYAPAQTTLGVMYQYGRGVAQDQNKAVEWYTKAADQGDARAQNYLGAIYHLGQGVAQDPNKALDLFTKAADQGDARAQTNLGVMYQYGQGVAQDPNKAVELYTKAADQGYARAQNNLGEMYYHGWGVLQDLNKAIEWYTKAADQGDAFAQNYLGAMYHLGQGVLQDPNKALDCFTKAADQGYAPAQTTLGVMYQYGQGVAQDPNKARDLFTKAADQGDALAQNYLGVMYQNRQGIAQNLTEALKWYLKSHSCQNLSIELRNEIKRSIKSLVTPFLSTITADQVLTYEHKLVTLEETVQEAMALHMLQQECNNSDSAFKEAAFAIPSLFKTYQQIVVYENDFLAALLAYKNPGFMTTCLQPIYNKGGFRVSRCSDIKYYEINGQSFLTFGKKNIEIADKLIDIVFNPNICLLFFQAVDEILELHKQKRRNYQIKAMDIQAKSRQNLIPQDQVPAQKEALTHQNDLITQADQEMGYLTTMRSVPQLQELFKEGIPYRNRLFLHNNAHMGSLFE